MVVWDPVMVSWVACFCVLRIVLQEGLDTRSW